MTDPHLVVVDVETSGTDPSRHCVLEVAAIDLTTHEELRFVPRPPAGWMENAELEALAVNRYMERRLWELEIEANEPAWKALAQMLDGNMIAGANPGFDGTFLRTEMKANGLEPTWSYRTRDLATYAAGVLGLDPAEPHTASGILRLLDIDNTLPHTAYGDALAEATAFHALIAMKRPQRPFVVWGEQS